MRFQQIKNKGLENECEKTKNWIKKYDMYSGYIIFDFDIWNIIESFSRSYVM